MLPYIPFEWEVCAVIRMKHSAKNIIGIVIFSVTLTNEDIFQGRLEKKRNKNFVILFFVLVYFLILA